MKLSLPLKLTVTIFAIFGLTFAGMFAYRKYSEYRKKRTCVIEVGADGEYRIEGRLMNGAAILSHFKERAPGVKYTEGFVKGGELERAIFFRRPPPPECFYVRIPEQPFPLKVSVSAGSDFEHLQRLVPILYEAGMFNKYELEIERREKLRLTVGIRPDYNAKIIPEGTYPTIDPPPGLVSLRRIYVKLLWYSPSLKPERYTGPDGKFVLKIRATVFGEPGKPDWSGFVKYVRSKWKELKAEAAGDTDYFEPPCITLFGRDCVPMEHVIKALRIIKSTGCEYIFIAPPEIPY
ncbi:MAG: hypothetical protein ACYS8W_08670 [Planctomycetota bacterium]